MQENSYKEQYARALILKHEISAYHKELSKDKSLPEKWNTFVDCFIKLDILRDSLKYYDEIMKNRKDLQPLAKGLRKRLDFINHLRNKVSGHLDELVLKRALEWDPMIFQKSCEKNEKLQLILLYKALLESAIHSYLDQNRKKEQIAFKDKIDLLIPEDVSVFYNFIGELNKDCIEFLSNIITHISEEIEYWDKECILKIAIKAGKTDFNLKSQKKK